MDCRDAERERAPANEPETGRAHAPGKLLLDREIRD
jgi:hypothetical protein